MRVRDLKTTSGHRAHPSWPPLWVSFYGRPDDCPPGEGGTLESVRRITYSAGGVDHLLLVKTVADTEYVAALKWDESPGVASVEALLRGHLGKSIRAIGELEL
jgi:hypothetical protein